MNYSLTHSGILVAVLGSATVTFLVQMGISEACANEVWAAIAPLVPVGVGGAMAWIGRIRAGGVTTLGVKK